MKKQRSGSSRSEKGKSQLSPHLILHRTSKEKIRAGVPVITKGEGVYVFDENGKRYLDLSAGNTRPVHIGYGREEMAQTVAEQILELSYFTPMGYGNLPASKLADAMAEISPGAIDHFTFVCDGSEAVETALKLAKHFHFSQGGERRYKVISRRGAYHGVTGGALRALGTALPMRQMMEPLSPGVVFVESPYCYRCPLHLEYPDCDIACARDIERIIQFEDPTQVSAFIGEPIQQGFGAYRPPAEYWEIVRGICDRYGVLLIMDEVICGFGRTGKWFAVQHFGIEPDIMTMAKGISSGYVPLGGVGCSFKVWDPIDTFQHIHTYGNHPVSCAAALKNIEIIKNENLVQRSAEMGAYFLEGLRSLEHHRLVGEVRGTGLWTAIDLTTDKAQRSLFPMSRMDNLVLRGRAKGLILKFMGPSLEFAPSLTIQKEQIDDAIKLVEECLVEEAKDMGLS
jgi:adenosylmethionine-8-amino-7-oxononanoate aminotransferase